MAVVRDKPYADFNFLVDLGTGDFKAGFSEVSGLGLTVDVIEYRNGNDKANTTRKITGLYKVPDVTLKRGVTGSLELYNWINQVRNGDQNALRTVIIALQNEDHSATVEEWRLQNARPVKYVGPLLSASTSAVAIEELVLASENIEVL